MLLLYLGYPTGYIRSFSGMPIPTALYVVSAIIVLLQLFCGYTNYKVAPANKKKTIFWIQLLIILGTIGTCVHIALRPHPGVSRLAVPLTSNADR